MLRDEMSEMITFLYENTWAIEDGHVRCFLLAGKTSALLIDSGISGLDLKRIAGELTDLPLKLLNTHADPDHTAGNAAFPEFYMHPSEAMVYHKIHHGKGRILPVYDKDRLDLGGRVLEVLHVPGHTPGSITILDPDRRCLLGGDPIQENGDIFMFGIHRDLEAYALGLEHLLKRSDEFDVIYPSHAKMPVSKDIIPALIQGAKDIQNGLVKGTAKEVHGKEVNSCDIGITRFLCEP